MKDASELRREWATRISFTISFLIDDDAHMLKRTGFAGNADPDGAIEDVRRTLQSYGQRLVEMPLDVLESLPFEADWNGLPPSGTVDVRLWTEEEAPSDLLLSMRFTAGALRTDPVCLSEVVSLAVVPFEGVRGVPPPPVERPPLERVVRDPDPELDPVPERWRAMLGELVHRLVVGDFDGLVDDGLVTEGFVPYLRESVTSYSAHLVDLPEEAWAYSHHIAGDDPVAEVTVWLWSEEEGISDLSMDATIWDDGINPPTAQIFMIEVK